jgi:D-tyrosyl-tRNA(Tyr) deacylase
MRAVVQRVTRAAVTIDVVEVAGIARGLAVLACVEEGDTPSQRTWMADKLANLRIFPDDAGKMNLSLLDIKGEMLLVSNFTVAGDCRSGRRPGFDRAMKPPRAKEEFDALVEAVRALGVPVRTGVFAADIRVTIENDGPVTLVVESGASVSR